MIGDPGRCGETVVGCRREAGLGGVAVVDRHDDRVRVHAQVAAQRVVGGGAAEHPAATVEVGHDRMGPVGRRPVQAVLEWRAVGAGQRAVDDLADLGPGGIAAPDASMNARAPSTPIVSSGGRSSSAIIVNIAWTSGFSGRMTPSLVFVPLRRRDREAEVARGRRPRRRSPGRRPTPPGYGRNTCGLPGTFAPMYHELAVGSRVRSAISLLCCTHSAWASSVGSIVSSAGRTEVLERVGDPGRRAARSTPSCSTAPTGCRAR